MCMFLDSGTGEFNVQLFLSWDYRNGAEFCPRSGLNFNLQPVMFSTSMTLTLFIFYLQSSEQHHLLLGAVDVFQQNGPARLLVHLCQAHNIVLHKQRQTVNSIHTLSVKHHTHTPHTHTDLGVYIVEGKVFKTKPDFVIFLNSLLQETS